MRILAVVLAVTLMGVPAVAKKQEGVRPPRVRKQKPAKLPKAKARKAPKVKSHPRNTVN
jgi:hypothetical protein